MKKHILFTAREVGASHHIKHIARAIRKRGYVTSIIASGVAYAVFKKEKLKPILFSINGKKPVIRHNAPKQLIDKLLAFSYKKINETKPDAVFCGLGAPGYYGIDEATLYWAAKNRLNIPSFQFLDTWGTFNHLKDGYPDIYFAIDKTAQKYTYKGAKAPIKIAGSPKHESYSSKPINRWRNEIRKRLNISKNNRLIGYFGQDPAIPGYIQNFNELVKAVSEYNKKPGKKCSLLIMGHPGYKDKHNVYDAVFRRKNDVTGIHAFGRLDTEQVLCACDIIATCFSTVAVDHAYLSCYAKRPIGAALYLMCNDRIKKFLSDKFGYWKNPMLVKGVGFCADKPGQVLKKIEHILDNPSVQLKYFEATSSLVGNNNSCEKIIDTVASFI